MTAILRALVLAQLVPCPALSGQQVSPVPVTRPVDYEPAWSPDGTHIAFISNRTGPLKVWVMRADGTEPRQLTTGADEDDAPAWSPDGRRIAFVRILQGDAELFVMREDGSELRRLTTSPGADIHPQWAPDGRRLLFNSARRSRDPANPEVIELFTMRPDGSDVRPLTRGGIATYASFSPDGAEVVFRRQQEDGNSEIVVRAVDGGEERNLTRNPAFDGWPAWSRDGRRVVFARETDGDSAVLLVVNLDGSGETPLVTLPGRNTNPRWSPDRDVVLFSHRADGQVRLFLVEVP